MRVVGVHLDIIANLGAAGSPKKSPLYLGNAKKAAATPLHIVKGVVKLVSVDVRHGQNKVYPSAAGECLLYAVKIALHFKAAASLTAGANPLSTKVRPYQLTLFIKGKASAAIVYLLRPLTPFHVVNSVFLEYISHFKGKCLIVSDIFKCYIQIFII